MCFLLLPWKMSVMQPSAGSSEGQPSSLEPSSEAEDSLSLHISFLHHLSFPIPQITELALWGCLGLCLQTLVAITFPKDTLMYYLVQIKYGLDIRDFISCLFTSLLNSLISLFTFTLFLPLLLALYILKFQWIPLYPDSIFSATVAK